MNKLKFDVAFFPCGCTRNVSTELIDFVRDVGKDVFCFQSLREDRVDQVGGDLTTFRMSDDVKWDS